MAPGRADLPWMIITFSLSHYPSSYLYHHFQCSFQLSWPHSNQLRSLLAFWTKLWTSADGLCSGRTGIAPHFAWVPFHSISRSILHPCCWRSSESAHLPPSFGVQHSVYYWLACYHRGSNAPISMPIYYDSRKYSPCLGFGSIGWVPPGQCSGDHLLAYPDSAWSCACCFILRGPTSN